MAADAFGGSAGSASGGTSGVPGSAPKHAAVGCRICCPAQPDRSSCRVGRRPASATTARGGAGRRGTPVRRPGVDAAAVRAPTVLRSATSGDATSGSGGAAAPSFVDRLVGRAAALLIRGSRVSAAQRTRETVSRCQEFISFNATCQCPTHPPDRPGLPVDRRPSVIMKLSRSAAACRGDNFMITEPGVGTGWGLQKTCKR